MTRRVKYSLLALLASLLGCWFFLMTLMLEHEERQFYKNIVMLGEVTIVADPTAMSAQDLEAALRESLEPQLPIIGGCLLNDGVSAAPATLRITHPAGDGQTRIAVLKTTEEKPDDADRCLSSGLSDGQWPKPAFDARVELVLRPDS